jgi:hypothetical protein
MPRGGNVTQKLRQIQIMKGKIQVEKGKHAVYEDGNHICVQLITENVTSPDFSGIHFQT